MLDKINYWFGNFVDGIVAIFVDVGILVVGILLRLTDMVVPDNRIFLKFKDLSTKEIRRFLEEEGD